MTLIEQLEAMKADMSAQLGKANADLAFVTAEREVLTAQRDAAEAKVTTLMGQVTELTAKATEQATQLAALQAEKAELSAGLEKAKIELAQPQRQDLSAGRAPVSTGTPSAGEQEDVLVKFNAITDPVAKANFYKENEAKIKQAARAARG